jgi:predicted DNA-binding transcriptional regulator AlpA
MRANNNRTESPVLIGIQLDRHLDEHEVSNITGTPVATLRYWRVLRKKGPPYRRIGKRVAYPENLLRAWLESLPMGGEAA